MKKLAKVFKGCLIWLGIAVLVSLIYFLAAITGHLEVTEETLNPTTSVIIVLCFMLIPPIILMIVLICKRKVFDLVNPIEENSKTENDSNSEDEQIVQEQQIQAQHEYDEKISAEIQALLESQLSFIEKTAKKFYNPTVKMIESFCMDFNFGQEEDVIEFINDILTVYETSLDEYPHLRKQILQDCPNFQFESSIDNLFYEDHIRVIKAYFGELLNCVKVVFIDNAHAAACATYCIARANIIRYFDGKYKKEINAESLEEFCSILRENADEDEQVIGYICNMLKSDMLVDCGVFTKYQTVKAEIKAQLSKLLDKQTYEGLFDDSIAVDSDLTEKSLSISLEETIDRMSGLEFEQFLAKLFAKKGYGTKVTKASGDFGIDIIADNGIVRVGIQAKCYSSSSVGNDAVQQAAAGCLYYGLDKAMVITNSYFTAAAIEQARSSKVTLWNRDDLLKECRENGMQ